MNAPTDPRTEPGEHGDWDALAVGWALSALDRADEERFAAHLPGCAPCTATVRESLYTVADLAYALPDETPPPAMKMRLMAAVAAEPRSAGTAPARENWPLGEPHPGSPGYNSDLFAEPPAGRPAVDPVAGGAAEDPGAAGSARGHAADSPVTRPADSGVAGAGGPAQGHAADGPATRPVRPAEHGPAGRPAADGPAGGAAEPPVRTSGPDPSPPHVRRDENGDRHPGGSRSDRVVVPMDPHRRRRRALTGVAAAAVVALIAALGAWNLNLRSEQNDLRQLVAQREAAIQQLTANGPARVAALTQTGQPSPTRKATLVVRGDQVEIIVETLGATPADRTYWLWTLRCDNGVPADPKPVRGFTVTQPAFSVRNIGSDADVATATCFAISSEPGTATPTEPHDVQAIGQPKI